MNGGTTNQKTCLSHALTKALTKALMKAAVKMTRTHSLAALADCTWTFGARNYILFGLLSQLISLKQLLFTI